MGGYEALVVVGIARTASQRVYFIERGIAPPYAYLLGRLGGCCHARGDAPWE